MLFQCKLKKKVKLIKLIRTHKSLVENFIFNMQNKLTGIFFSKQRV